jgi:hypothetical protein
MASFALLLLFGAGGAVLAMGTPFLRALQAEAPKVYEAIGAPPINGYMWRRRFFPPFAGMLLSLSYRSSLQGCPVARAWGSRLALALWVQVSAAMLLAVSLT